MFTTGSKVFFGFTFVMLAAALAYGWTTGGNGLGPVTGGYKGSVGDHVGYTILLATAAATLFLGFVVAAFRDADPEAEAEVAGTNVPPAVAPAGVSYWPAAAGFLVGVTVLGLVISNVLFVIGLIGLGMVAVEWLVLSWSERATGDPAANREIRNRLMYPFEIPLAGALAVLFVVVSISRVLLAVSALNAVWVAMAAAIIVLGVGSLVAARPTIGPNLIAGILAVLAVGVLAAGVIGASVGERDFHHGEDEDQDEDHAEETDEEHGLAPLVVEAGS